MAYLVQVMERLRAPGGCPWDAQQDHRSLVQYLLEEAYEAAEAIEAGSREDLREELGDVLLQVVFHASIAAGEPDPFDLDDVAQQVADKLVSRHPWVFCEAEGADGEGGGITAEQSYARWDRIKEQEKQRQSVLEGIPVAQSALARAQKVVGRARRGEVPVELPDGAGLGPRLLALVAEADGAGLDAEAELRAAVRLLEQQIRDLEQAGREAVAGERN
ncbi:MAG: MazG family protein [Bifidobacteriaceae bacterium]|nr:MazG family protein [Bifidobacteriaceae bacterium]